MGGIAFCLGGCSKAPRWVGTYVGKQDGLVSESAPDDVIAASLERVELTIKPDMSFTLIKAGFPISGRVILSGDSATLQVTAILGTSIERESPQVQEQYSDISLEWIDKDALKLIDKDDFNRPPVTLHRQEESGEAE